MMKKVKITWLSFLVFTCLGLMLQSFSSSSDDSFSEESKSQSDPVHLKKEALTVLETKCNVCHRKQNPFRVFKEKNMERFASKIHEQVFIKKRMPKAGQSLTDKESKTLKTWLLTQNINNNGND
jgi:uncharacterized membrane protein